jgi:hypothetical protein
VSVVDTVYTAAMNKKSKKNNSRRLKTTGKKGKSIKRAVRKKGAAKGASNKKSTLKKVAARPKASRKRTGSAKTPAAQKRRATGEAQMLDTDALALQGRRSRSAGQSGDLQGLSALERADSESVDELLEEGNTFEAGAVAGVESADDADEREVHTLEVPEDDVPGEYQEKD